LTIRIGEIQVKPEGLEIYPQIAQITQIQTKTNQPQKGTEGTKDLQKTSLGLCPKFFFVLFVPLVAIVLS